MKAGAEVFPSVPAFYYRSSLLNADQLIRVTPAAIICRMIGNLRLLIFFVFYINQLLILILKDQISSSEYL